MTTFLIILFFLSVSVTIPLLILSTVFPKLRIATISFISLGLVAGILMIIWQQMEELEQGVGLWLYPIATVLLGISLIISPFVSKKTKENDENRLKEIAQKDANIASLEAKVANLESKIDSLKKEKNLLFRELLRENPAAAGKYLDDTED